MTSPPPPYSLQPPPAYFYSSSRKLPCPPGQSSRQTLSNALQRARHAVQLDSSGSDIPSAVAAYGEAIELLQCVIARRSRKPGNEAEVGRVVDIVSLLSQKFHPLPVPFPFPLAAPPWPWCRKAPLFFYISCPGVSPVLNVFFCQHDRYAHRVRELCRARRLPLPSHVADAPSASLHPLRVPPPDAVSPTSAHSAYHESEWDTEISSLLSSSATLSSASSVDSLQWIVSEACDEEVKEWGQYLSGSGDDDRRASVATAASSAVWSTIAVSHG